MFRRFLQLVAVLAAPCALATTLTIPPNTVQEVTGANLPTIASTYSEIVISEGATLSFTNITAGATFTGTKFSGTGRLLAVNDADGKIRITFRATDFTEFLGDAEFCRVYFAFDWSQNAAFPIKMVENNKNTYSFYSGTYPNPLDFNGGPNQGIAVAASATLSGDITYRDSSSASGKGGKLAGIGGDAGSGKVTGDVFCNNGMYAEGGITLEGSKIQCKTGGGLLVVDGSALNLKSKMVNFTGIELHRLAGCLTFLADDLVPEACTVTFGVSWGAGGALDLNGHSQKCKSISIVNAGATDSYISSTAGAATLSILNQQGNATFPGPLNGHLSLAYASSGAKTLTLTAPANTADGTIAVSSGAVVLGADATFPNLTGIQVDGTGSLTVNNATVGAGLMDVTVSGSGKLTLNADIKVNHFKLGDDYLEPGDYEAGSAALSKYLGGTGKFHVANGKPVEKGATFHWNISGSGALTVPTNWLENKVPEFDGTETLVFGAQATSATVTGPIKVYGIEISANQVFTLTGSGETAAVKLGPGGIVTKSPASGTILHVLDVPVTLDALPQVWTLAKNAELSQVKPWTGRYEPGLEFEIDCSARVHFKADNSGLLTTLRLKNCRRVTTGVYATDDVEPYIFSGHGLGADSREVILEGMIPRFNVIDGDIVNTVPLRVSNPDANVAHSAWARGYQHKAYVDGLVTFAGNDEENYFPAETHFRGGIVKAGSGNVYFRPNSDYDVWIEEKPVTLSGGLYLDYARTLHLGSTNNSWTLVNPYKGGIKCHNPYVLATNGFLRMSDYNSWAKGTKTKLDLNGFDQKVTRFYVGWSSTDYATYFTTVDSAAPAVLEVASGTVYNDKVQARFLNAAGFRFNAAGSIEFGYQASETTGTLEALRGTVKLADGARWANTTNLVVGAAGKLDIDATAAANTFCADTGKSNARLKIATGGKVNLGRDVTVRTLTLSNGTEDSHLPPGIYGGPDAGLEKNRTLDCLTGSCKLTVQRYYKAGLLFVFR